MKSTIKYISKRLNSLNRFFNFINLVNTALFIVTIIILATLILINIGDFFYKHNVDISIIYLTTGIIFFVLLIYHIKVRYLKDNTFIEFCSEKFRIEENLLPTFYSIFKDYENYIKNYSKYLVDETIKLTETSIFKMSIKNVFEHQLNRKIVYAFFITYLILISSVMLDDNLVDKYYFLTKTYNVPIIKRNEFKVLPGNVNILEGTAVTISIEVKGTKYSNLALHVSYDNKKFDKLKLHSKNNKYNYIINDVTTDISYYISTEHNKTEVYSINVFEMPVIAIQSIHYKYPEYTSLPDKIVNTGDGNIEAVYGTESEIYFNINFKPEFLKIKFKNSGKIIKPVKLKDNYKFNVKFINTDKYYFDFKTGYNIKNQAPVYYVLKTIQDEYPLVKIVDPGKDKFFNDDMVEYFTILITDDYGLKDKSYLNFKISGKDYKEKILVKETGGNYLGYPIIDFSKYELLPGDEIRYFAETYDNDTLNGPKKGISNSFVLRVPSMIDVYDEVEKENKAVTRMMNALQSKNTEMKDEINKVITKMLRENKMTWESQKQIQDLYKKQQGVKKQLEQVKDRLNKAVNQYKRTKKLLGTETIRKLQKLNKLLQNVISDDVKKSMEHLQKAIKNRDLSEKVRQLKMSNFNRDRFNKKIDRTISLLQKMQKFSLMKSIRKSLFEQELNQKMVSEELLKNKENMSKMVDTQKKITQELKKMKEKMDDLISSEKNPSIRKSLENIKKNLEGLMNQSQQLKNKFSKNKNSNQQKKQNLKSSNDIRKQMQQLNEKLSGMMKKSMETDLEHIKKELDKIISDCIYFSELIKDTKNDITKYLDSLNNEYSTTEKLDYNYLSELVYSYQVFIRNISYKVFELSQQSLLISPELIAKFNEVYNSLENSKEHLANNDMSQGKVRLINVYKQINVIISSLLNLSDELDNQMNQNNMNSMLDRMSQLSKAQQQLNRMSFGLNNMTQEMLDQMAFEQSVIRQSIERMQSGMKQGSDLGDKLSDIVKKMKEVEKELKGGNFNKDVKKKQEDILNKMLDSTKSLTKKEKFSKKREGKLADDKYDKKEGHRIKGKEINVDIELKDYLKKRYPDIYKEHIKRLYKSLMK